ncbi:MAG: hypothetical protein ACI9ON_003095 [Limisphaerales bacterium]|jgi:hypothetical protein
MQDRLRGYLELIGVLCLVGSLLFVGYELKVTRDMNMVDLHYNRMSLYQEIFSAQLESEHYLNVHAKRFLLEWDSGDLTPAEKAASEINANNILIAFEYEYRLIQQGYSLRTKDELRQDILQYISPMPEIQAALSTWTDDPRYEFNAFMKGILSEIVDGSNY